MLVPPHICTCQHITPIQQHCLDNFTPEQSSSSSSSSSSPSASVAFPPSVRHLELWVDNLEDADAVVAWLLATLRRLVDIQSPQDEHSTAGDYSDASFCRYLTLDLAQRRVQLELLAEHIDPFQTAVALDTLCAQPTLPQDLYDVQQWAADTLAEDMPCVLQQVRFSAEPASFVPPNDATRIQSNTGSETQTMATEETKKTKKTKKKKKKGRKIKGHVGKGDKKGDPRYVYLAGCGMEHGLLNINTLCAFLKEHVWMTTDDGNELQAVHVVVDKPYVCVVCASAEAGMRLLEWVESTAPTWKDVFGGSHDRSMVASVSSLLDNGIMHLSSQECIECTCMTQDIEVPGLHLIHDFVTEQEETAMLEAIYSSEWHTKDTNRRVQHYGYEFDYKKRNVLTSNSTHGNENGNGAGDDDGHRLDQGEGDESDTATHQHAETQTHREEVLPTWAHTVADRLMGTGLLPSRPDQLTVNEYEPGQGISGHADRHSSFTDGIVSVSLAADIAMEFRHAVDGRKRQVWLPRRSVLIMTQESRYIWQHRIYRRSWDRHAGSLLPRNTRISLTFRALTFADSCDCQWPPLCDSQMHAWWAEHREAVFAQRELHANGHHGGGDN